MSKSIYSVDDEAIEERRKKYRLKMARWRAQNPERNKEYQKQWRTKNAEHFERWQQDYQEKNLEELKTKARLRARQYRLDHPEKAKLAVKKASLSKKYGLTLEEYETMFEQQNRCCAACSTDDPKSKRGWHVDHCHKTKKVRGILCGHCNVALGYVADDVSVLEGLIEYLKRSQD